MKSKLFINRILQLQLTFYAVDNWITSSHEYQMRKIATRVFRKTMLTAKTPRRVALVVIGI